MKTLAELDQDTLNDMSIVDIVYCILKEKKDKKAIYLNELMLEIARYKEIDQKKLEQVKPQIYTEINIDGRFKCNEEKKWGLKIWYNKEEDLIDSDPETEEDEEPKDEEGDDPTELNNRYASDDDGDDDDRTPDDVVPSHLLGRKARENYGCNYTTIHKLKIGRAHV